MAVLRVLVPLLIALSLSACAGHKQLPNAFHKALQQPYRLDSGDSLRIVVFGQNDLSNVYKVDQSGHITMPLIGAVPARGRTSTELEREIAISLKKGYVRRPDVSVEIAAYRPFFIMGEVNTAGQFPYVAGMTVQMAVATAGGFSPRANHKNVDITRRINGRVLNGRVPITDPIRPGDTIYVRERFF